MFEVGSEQVSCVSVKTHRKNNWKNCTLCWARRAWKNNFQGISEFKVAQWLKNKLLLKNDCEVKAASQMSDTVDGGGRLNTQLRAGMSGSGPLRNTIKIGFVLR